MFYLLFGFFAAHAVIDMGYGYPATTGGAFVGRTAGIVFAALAGALAATR